MKLRDIIHWRQTHSHLALCCMGVWGFFFFFTVIGSLYQTVGRQITWKDYAHYDGHVASSENSRPTYKQWWSWSKTHTFVVIGSLYQTVIRQITWNDSYNFGWGNRDLLQWVCTLMVGSSVVPLCYCCFGGSVSVKKGEIEAIPTLFGCRIHR